MALNKIENFDEQFQVKLCKQRSLTKLQLIQPKWAYGKDSNKIYVPALRPENNEFTIFLTNTLNFINVANFLGTNLKHLFTGESLNDKRIAEILFRWEHNLFIDPPSVCATSKCKIGFYDGRHRSKLSYLLGFKQMPIAILNSDIKVVSKIISLTSIKT